jgi:hypothetical protein
LPNPVSLHVKRKCSYLLLSLPCLAAEEGTATCPVVDSRPRHRMESPFEWFRHLWCDYGTITAENRENVSSWLISIPFLQVHSHATERPNDFALSGDRDRAIAG